MHDIVSLRLEEIVARVHSEALAMTRTTQATIPRRFLLTMTPHRRAPRSAKRMSDIAGL
jgi:hypothetical protein